MNLLFPKQQLAGEEIFTVLTVGLSQVDECWSVSTCIPHFTRWVCGNGFLVSGSSIPTTTAGSATHCPTTLPVRGPQHCLQTPCLLPSPLLQPPDTFLPGKSSPQAHGGDHHITWPSLSLLTLSWQSARLHSACWSVAGGWSCHCEGFGCAFLQTIAVCLHYICSY